MKSLEISRITDSIFFDLGFSSHRSNPVKRIGKGGEERSKRVIFEDLVSLENVRNVSQVELLASLLPHRVGSLLSINNLSAVPQVAFETTKVGIHVGKPLCMFSHITGPTQACVLLKKKKVYVGLVCRR